MSEVVVKLEALLTEFYHHTTSNSRKKEIEVDLKSFQENDSSWSLVLEIISSSHLLFNQYLWFFSVSTLELTITKKWHKLDSAVKNLIRDKLWQIFVNFPINVGTMQLEKVAQLISLIGKREFPGCYIQQVLCLLKSKFVLGITLLKATFGEISSTKNDCTYQEKTNFLQGVTLSLQEILNLLNQLLTLCVCRVSDSIEKNRWNAIDRRVIDDMNEDQFSFCCSSLLTVFSGAFSLLTSSNEMTAEFYDNIFELCSYNSNEKFISIRVEALITVSELFYLQRKLHQPQIIANGIAKLIQQGLLGAAEEYQDKLTELLKLFLIQQWTRLANTKEFNSKEFLLHLFNFTFSDGISLTSFANRLQTWTPVIQSFNEKEAGSYSETLEQLISNVFKKMQCSNELLDNVYEFDEEFDDTTENAADFLNTCITTIEIAAEVEPAKVFDLIHNEFIMEDSDFQIFLVLLNTFPEFSAGASKVQAFNVDDLMASCNSKPLNKPFYYLIRDLSSLLQTIQSVVLMQTDERSHSISNIMKSLFYALKLSNRKKLHLLDFGNPLLTAGLIELQTQLLVSIKNFLLLPKMSDHEETFNMIASLTLEVTNDVQESLMVRNSSAQLLVSVTSCIRPKFILQEPQFMQLLQSNLSTDRNLRLKIKRIVFNCLLLPYKKVAVNQIEEQEYEKRGQFLQHYVDFVSQEFLRTDLSFASPFVLEQTEELTEYGEILAAFEDTNTISKQMLLAGLQKVINKAIELFHSFGKRDPVIYSKIINFCLALVRCLQLQLGSSFVIQIIRMFLESATVSHGDDQAMNKLLQMLIFIVQSGSSASLAPLLLDDVLKLTLDDMLPLERTHDVSANLYSLFAEILQNHWNYFQKPTPPGMSTRCHHDDLMKIFNAYGQFLCGIDQDPNVIRIILSSLEKLNELCRLYEKVFFKNYLLKSFLSCLLRMLVTPGCGILFCDQIITITFHMAEKDTSVLFECFASIGFPEMKIVQKICESSDLPTFSNLVQIFIQDTIYFYSTGQLK